MSISQHSQSHKNSSQAQQSNDKLLLEGRWNDDQHIQFLKAVLVFGKDWKKVEELIDSRNGSQVRSHAQKFFLKIAKINKERRRHKNKPFQLSETEKQILQLFTQEDVTENSPPELVAIIQKKFNQAPLIEASSHKKEKQHKKGSSSESEYSVKKQRPKRQSYSQSQPAVDSVHRNRSLSFEKLDDVFDEEDSLFMQLYKKNANHFRNGGQFSDLIDFGKNVAQCQQTSPRKQSFSIMEIEPNQGSQNP